VAAFFVNECDRNVPLVAIPYPEIHMVFRFGPSARNGLDGYAFGAQQSVRRKVIRGGQRTVTVRLHLGAAQAVLGVPASAISGHIVPLEELWGEATTSRLYDQLTEAHTTIDAAAIVESAIAERLADADTPRTHSPLALEAAERLMNASVSTVAADLRVSERHLRRVFREAAGLSPKTFAKLARFHRALHAARQDSNTNWANIAAATGYYDQAHLIDEFQTIAGITPRAFLCELDAIDAQCSDTNSSTTNLLTVPRQLNPSPPPPNAAQARHKAQPSHPRPPAEPPK
jgi:AraC-like DNA-binding protein